MAYLYSTMKESSVFKFITRIFCSCLLSLIIATHSYAEESYAELVKQAQNLIQTGAHQQAYDLLRKKETEFGDKAEFNYHLGFAALQAGKHAEAVFALERALILNPDLPQARADLGRAYYYLGENASAKEQFQQVQYDETTPGSVRSTIDKFLSAIQSRFDSSGQRLEFFIDAGVGFDSNVNSATSLDEVVLPVFAQFGAAPIDENSQEQDSIFFEIEPAVRFSKPIQEDLNLYASADLKLRETPDASDFSTRVIDGVVGLGFLRGSSQYRAALSLQNYAVDGDNFRDQVAVNAEWHKSIDSKNRLTSFIQIADLSYDELNVRDGSQFSLGSNWLRSIGSSLYYLGLFYGDESVDESSQRFQERNFFGAKLGGRWVHNNNSIFGNIVLQSSKYGAENPVWLETRKDTFLSIEAGYEIPWRRDLSLKPKISFTQNSSNIDVFEYDRFVLGVYAAYKF